ncbi:MAG: ATP synthase F1 subunit delta [Candidatus Melainabacteria bacterium RIFCSPLOWO2_02_FULL_35_15]|nr:MAG: ATP synthase F1 subunit delta [Candidatus Melainabacteria bacterium RIFCSPLOWO2_12_FULL_35_11]OGI13152.1 MAG: ATP synthase F1 subunit delta [Candidatus Melainabacteria bacterium RIFCSPLOWO2_02_FULL_35_15]
MKQSQKIAKNYAQALLELTNNDLQLQEIMLNEIKTITESLDKVKNSWGFFNSPGISKDEKKEFIKKMFSGKINEKILNLLFLLIDNKRFNILSEIQNQLSKLVNKSRGTTVAEVYSAVDIDSNTMEKLKQSIANTIGHNEKVEVESKVERSLIGGIKIKINDLVYDGSIKGRLEALKEKLC